MADPLSIVASIAGIATASIQLANAIYRICEKLRHAPQEIQQVASSITSLSLILEDVAEIIEFAKDKAVYKPRVLRETSSILARFERVQADVRKIVENQRTKFRGRFRWLFKASKVAELLMEMEGLKSGLQLVISIVHFAMERKATVSDSNKDTRLRNLVETVIRENRLKILHFNEVQKMQNYQSHRETRRLTSGSTGRSVEGQRRRYLEVGSDSNLTSEDAESRGTLQSPLAPGKDTATWLYRLSFVPEAEDEVKDEAPPALSELEVEEILPTSPILSRSGTMEEATDGDLSPMLVGGEPTVAGLASEPLHDQVEEKHHDDKPNQGDANTPGTSVTTPQHSSPGRKEPGSVESKPPGTDLVLHVPVERLRYIKIPSAITNLLDHWTFLRPDQTVLVKVEMDQKEHDDKKEDVEDGPTDEQNPFFNEGAVNDKPASGRVNDNDDWYFRSNVNGTSANAKEAQPHRRASGRDRQPSRPESDEWANEDYNPSLNTTSTAGKSSRNDMSNTPRHRRARSMDSRPTLRQVRFDSDPLAYMRDEATRERLHTPSWEELDEEVERQRLKRSEELAKVKKQFLEARLRLEAEKEEETQKARAELRYMKEQLGRQLRDEKAGNERKRVLQEVEMKERLKRLEADEFRRKVLEEAEQAKAAEEKDRAHIKLEAEVRHLRDVVAEHRKQESERKSGEDKMSFSKAELRELKEDIIKQYEADRKEDPGLTDRSSSSASVSSTASSADTDITASIANSRVNSLLHEIQHKFSRTYKSPNKDGYYNLSPAHIPFAPQTGLSSSISQPAILTHVCERDSSGIPSSASSSSGQASTSTTDLPLLHEKILLPTDYNAQVSRHNLLTSSLRESGVDALFELGSSRHRNGNGGRDLAQNKPRHSGIDDFIKGTLLWEPSAIPGGSELYETLWEVGWRPIYMRGCETGQTWFQGPQPIHVRFFAPNYIPQIERLANPSAATTAYVAIGNEWVERHALDLSGLPYRITANYCVLKPDVTYNDLLAVVAMSFLLRETGLRRAAKQCLDDEGSSQAKEPEPPNLEYLTGGAKLLGFGAV